MKKFICIATLFLLSLQYTNAQEIQANIVINYEQLGTKVPKTIFKNLQSQLSNFVNFRKWTNDQFLPNQKIQCNFLLTIESIISENFYKATLTAQVARPIFNSTYNSPLFSFQDKEIQFEYLENEVMDFDANRVQGNDPLQANLTAVFAYYVYLILGMNYDSFSSKGGDQYFQKAWNIVTNAPEGNSISGWKAFDGIRNRYWLCENFTNPKYNLVHDAYYNYYKKGMDFFADNADAARTGIADAIKNLYQINLNYPNTMVVQIFFQGKGNEIAQSFMKADIAVQQQVKTLLLKTDIVNSSYYSDLK